MMPRWGWALSAVALYAAIEMYTYMDRGRSVTVQIANRLHPFRNDVVIERWKGASADEEAEREREAENARYRARADFVSANLTKALPDREMAIGVEGTRLVIERNMRGPRCDAEWIRPMLADAQPKLRELGFTRVDCDYVHLAIDDWRELAQ